MASCKVGFVYIVETILTKPPKAKFALCVCVANGYFLWINTKPAPHGHDQLFLKAGCHPLIRHDSFLDLSRIVAHSSQELVEAREFPCIDADLRHQILAVIDAGLIALPPRHAMLIRENLSKL